KVSTRPRHLFGMLETTVDFGTPRSSTTGCGTWASGWGDPLSDSDPIVDSTLPDGSRINIIYSDDVSLKGSSLTIRQGDEVPLSINQITNWGTLSRSGGTSWPGLENDLQTVFVGRGDGSGKTRR
ncbi:hypothetical protein DJ77_02570, partial [Halorubrum ezzemoulense]